MRLMFCVLTAAEFTATFAVRGPLLSCVARGGPGLPGGAIERTAIPPLESVTRIQTVCDGLTSAVKLAISFAKYGAATGGVADAFSGVQPAAGTTAPTAAGAHSMFVIS